jgi:polysaccharide export outer membrane protein
MVLSFSFDRAVLMPLCGLMVALAGCAKPAMIPEPVDQAGLYGPGSTASYLIGADDKVQVSVWRNPELSVVVPVRPDGMISVPLIGDVQAGGMTPTDVGKAIEQKLSAYVRDPHVAVIVTELRSHEYLSRVRVTGAVRTPKSMPYRQGMTVLDAVLEAGGINEFASANRTKLYRRVKDKTEVVDVELGAILNKGDLETNALLRPGDVVTVPERLF